MSSNATSAMNRPTAKIYQFPLGGRAALAGRRPALRPTTRVVREKLTKRIYLDAWYHQAAIEDSEMARFGELR